MSSFLGKKLCYPIVVELPAASRDAPQDTLPPAAASGLDPLRTKVAPLVPASVIFLEVCPLRPSGDTEAPK